MKQFDLYKKVIKNNIQLILAEKSVILIECKSIYKYKNYKSSLFSLINLEYYRLNMQIMSQLSIKQKKSMKKTAAK